MRSKNRSSCPSFPPRPHRRPTQLAQAIVRLRYGLSEDNERQHGTTEIAHLLGIRRTTVQLVGRDAGARLRAFVAGKATLVKRHGKLCLFCPARDDCPPTPEQEAALTKAYTGLQAHAPSVSGRLLAQVAGASQRSAYRFLRAHRTETPKEARACQYQQKLEEVWTRLEGQGVRITGPLLAQEAGVMKQRALTFLKARRSESHARTKRGKPHHLPKKRRRRGNTCLPPLCDLSKRQHERG
jgi:hypothetical protein